MNDPILKIHWERFRAHVDLDIKTASELLAPYTHDPIDELTLLSEGCANTNYKVTLRNHPPVVIRIYLRDETALSREIDIHQLVKNKIPVPQSLYTDDQCKIYSHPYAIIEWMDGRLMREVILTEDERAIGECAFEAGQYLNKLRQITFENGGFFQKNLSVRPFAHEEQYLPFMLNLLNDKIVKDSLGNLLSQRVIELVKLNSKILPTENEANLTHADFDPANILVKHNNGYWQIAAVLDWEFAFAGNYLFDMGMMLRYSHKLPVCYESQFISGLQSTGFQLPSNWKKQAKLEDLICLLNLIHFNPALERPKLNLDVVSLIENTVNQWDSF